MKKYRYWTTMEIRTVMNNLDLTDRELGKILNRHSTSVNSYRRRNGIMKDPEVQKEAGRNYWKLKKAA